MVEAYPGLHATALDATRNEVLTWETMSSYKTHPRGTEEGGARAASEMHLIIYYLRNLNNPLTNPLQHVQVPMLGFHGNYLNGIH